MRLTIKATNITLTPDIREYLDKRLGTLSKIIDLDDPAVMVTVELGRTTRHHQTGAVFRAELNLYRGRESFRATAEEESIMAAIDEMRDEIAHELSARKGKRLSFIRRGGLLTKTLLKGGYAGLRRIRLPRNMFRPWRWWGEP